VRRFGTTSWVVVGMVVAADTTAGPAGYVIPAAWIVEAWPKLRRTLIPPPPYRGLLPFREADRELFFGREKEAAKLVDDPYATSVLTVVGPSGSGKSSLVQAGAVPRLRERGAAVALLRAGSGSEPLSTLGAALVPLIEPGLTRCSGWVPLSAWTPGRSGSSTSARSSGRFSGSTG
jgi:hypothetical protein